MCIYKCLFKYLDDAFILSIAFIFGPTPYE